VARPLTNWAANHTFSARETLQPASLDELQSAVRDRHRVKVLGTGHSFNAIADSDHTILLLDGLPAQIRLDRGHRHGPGRGRYLFRCPRSLRGHGGAECRCHALAAAVRTCTTGSVIRPRNPAKWRSRVGFDDHHAILDDSGQRDRLLHELHAGRQRRSASCAHECRSRLCSERLGTTIPGMGRHVFYSSELRGHEALAAARQSAMLIGVTVVKTLAGTMLLEGKPLQAIEVARALPDWRYSVDRKTTRAPERRPLARATRRRP
jgi:hypothetical protein